MNILTADPTSIEVNGTTTITVDAVDPDGDTLTYNWSATDGTIDGTGNSVTYTAPATLGTYTITVVVSDEHGGSATENINITVFEPSDHIIDFANGDIQFTQAISTDGTILTFDPSFNSPEFLFDNNSFTEHYFNDKNAYFYITFPEEKTVSKIILGGGVNNDNRYPTTFTIQISSDEIEWTNVIDSFSLNNGELTEKQLNVTGQFFRIYCQGGSNWLPRVNTLEVYVYK